MVEVGRRWSTESFPLSLFFTEAAKLVRRKKTVSDQSALFFPFFHLLNRLTFSVFRERSVLSPSSSFFFFGEEELKNDDDRLLLFFFLLERQFPSEEREEEPPLFPSFYPKGPSPEVK